MEDKTDEMSVCRKADGWYVKVRHIFLNRDHPDIGPFASLGHASSAADILTAIVFDAENEGARNYAMSDCS